MNLLNAKLLLQDVLSGEKNFELLQDWEKRVAVATETVNQILNKKFLPKTGMLVCDVSHMPSELFGRSVKELMDDGDFTQCAVCAKGGLMMSYLHLHENNFCYRDAIDSGNKPNSFINTALQDIFSKRQIAIIEAAFEGQMYLGMYLTDSDYTEDVRVSCRYYSEINNWIYRMLSIMLNIIEHNGEFYPANVVDVPYEILEASGIPDLEDYK